MRDLGEVFRFNRQSVLFRPWGLGVWEELSYRIYLLPAKDGFLGSQWVGFPATGGSPRCSLMTELSVGIPRPLWTTKSSFCCCCLFQNDNRSLNMIKTGREIRRCNFDPFRASLGSLKVVYSPSEHENSLKHFFVQYEHFSGLIMVNLHPVRLLHHLNQAGFMNGTEIPTRNYGQ